MYKFSASTGGFYLEKIHGADIPSDCVDVPEQYHAELMVGQAAGKRITADSAGWPVLADQLPPSPAQLWAQHQAVAQAALDASDITLLRCVEHGLNVPADWVAYRAALRAIVRAGSGDSTQALPTRPAYPAGT